MVDWSIRLSSLFILLVILSLLTSVPSNGSYSDYVNQYNISGSIEIPDEGKVTLFGSIKITAQDMGDTINYHHDYEATALGLGSEDDIFDIAENKSDKTLNLSTNTNTSIAVIFDLFSNFGENNISSFYHLTEEEVSSSSATILNYTAEIQKDQTYYSSFLEAEIDAYKVTIPLPNGNSIIVFYDAINYVMIGFSVTFMDHRVLDGAHYTIIYAIQSTNLALPGLVDNGDTSDTATTTSNGENTDIQENDDSGNLTNNVEGDNKLPLRTVTNIAAIGLVVITASAFLLRRLRTPEILDGGLD